MITKIELHSFKCFELLRLPMSPLTLLTGLNASGKSSVLQALALLHQTMSEHEWTNRLILNGTDVRLGTVHDVVDELSATDEFGIALEGKSRSGEDPGTRFSWRFVGDRREMSMGVREIAVDNLKSERPAKLRYLLPPGVFDENHTVKSLIDQIRRLSYITAERMSPRPVHQLEDSYAVDVVGTRGEHAASVLHWGRDEKVLDELAMPGTPPLLLHQVEARMGTLFPGCALSLQQAPWANLVILRLRTSAATDFHNPIHTGFGLTQILPVVVAALSASEGDIVLIENPELHLHPAGQSLMGQFMAEVAHAGIQVVAETHSDHVLNGVRRAVMDSRLDPDRVAIHFFGSRSGEDPQVQSPTIDDSGNIDDWPEGFFDQFDTDVNYFAGWG